jgi:adenylosuccinate synthase
LKPAVTIVLGLQWGDEGKGKILDVMAAEADWVLRAQGGNNAGHTVEIGKEKYVLHLIPSGILRGKVSCLIAGGAVVDPTGLAPVEGLVRIACGRDAADIAFLTTQGSCQLVRQSVRAAAV